LRACAGPRVLPRWRGVKHLTPAVNERYQNYATTIAGRKGVARVHLDTFWWGGPRASPNHGVDCAPRSRR
jgi:hypothetical protein